MKMVKKTQKPKMVKKTQKAKMVKKTQLKVLRISKAEPQVFPACGRLTSCDKKGCNVQEFKFVLEKAAKLSLKWSGPQRFLIAKIFNQL